MKSGLKLKLLTYYLQQDSTLKDYIYSFTILVKVKAYEARKKIEPAKTDLNKLNFTISSLKVSVPL